MRQNYNAMYMIQMMDLTVALKTDVLIQMYFHVSTPSSFLTSKCLDAAGLAIVTAFRM